MKNAFAHPLRPTVRPPLFTLRQCRRPSQVRWLARRMLIPAASVAPRPWKDSVVKRPFVVTAVASATRSANASQPPDHASTADLPSVAILTPHKLQIQQFSYLLSTGTSRNRVICINSIFLGNIYIISFPSLLCLLGQWFVHPSFSSLNLWLYTSPT